MFLDLDLKPQTAVACVDDSGDILTYGDLCYFSEEFGHVIDHRTLIFILAQNTNASLLGYIGALCNKIVPLIISYSTDKELYDRFVSIYSPEYIWAPISLARTMGYEACYENRDYCLLKTGLAALNLTRIYRCYCLRAEVRVVLNLYDIAIGILRLMPLMSEEYSVLTLRIVQWLYSQCIIQWAGL